MHPEEAGVQEQVVQRDVVQAPPGPRLVLVLDGLAHGGDRRLGDGGLVAERVNQGGLDVPGRQARIKEAITRDSRALVLEGI